jgi:hypothetical protein
MTILELRAAMVSNTKYFAPPFELLYLPGDKACLEGPVLNAP